MNKKNYLEITEKMIDVNHNLVVLSKKIENTEPDRDVDLSFNFIQIEEAIQKLELELNKTLEKVELKEKYKKEHMLEYVREALLDDKIDFENEDIRHSQAVEMDAENNSLIYRKYACNTETSKTYFILHSGEDSRCYEAHVEKATYGVLDNFVGYSLFDIGREELGWFDEDKNDILRQDLSVIEINGEKVLCLRVSSFYPYQHISYLMRKKIFYALSRLLRKNPHLVSDIIEEEAHSLQEQEMLLQKN